MGSKILDIETIVFNNQTNKADIQNKIDEKETTTLENELLVEAMKALEDNAEKKKR